MPDFKNHFSLTSQPLSLFTWNEQRENNAIITQLFENIDEDMHLSNTLILKKRIWRIFLVVNG